MFSFDMSGPEAATGVGDVVDARVERNIDVMVEANKLPRRPAPHGVFDRRFMPPAPERLKTH
jgi:NitT/TauT family transport system substrate-binding protein